MQKIIIKIDGKEVELTITAGGTNRYLKATGSKIPLNDASTVVIVEDDGFVLDTEKKEARKISSLNGKLFLGDALPDEIVEKLITFNDLMHTPVASNDETTVIDTESSELFDASALEELFPTNTEDEYVNMVNKHRQTIHQTAFATV